MSEGSSQIERWGIVEIMGHRVVAGRVTDLPGGVKRVDVLNPDGAFAFTQDYGPGAQFCTTWCDREVAVRAARQYDARPPIPLSLRLPARASSDGGHDFDEDSYIAECGDGATLEEEPDSPETDAEEPSDRAEAAQWARDLLAAARSGGRARSGERGGVILDVETTGLPEDGIVEIVQVGVLGFGGEVLLDTLVRPAHPIPPGATAIHGITNEAVEHAPAFGDLWTDLDNVLADQIVVCYNASFDFSALRAECDRMGRAYIDPYSVQDAMVEYARFWGEWDERKDDYRWVKLTDACKQQGIPAEGAHSAIGDCRLTLALVQKMAGDRATAVP